MHPEELKAALKTILGQHIVFNKQFDSYAQLLKNNEELLLPWCEKVARKEIPPIRSKTTNDIIFIKKLGSSTRCVVLKIVNGEFREVHLADHNYYDKLRKILGIKKDSV